MNKKMPWHGLHSGPPPSASEAEFREQWKLAPKILGPSIAERITAQSSKAKQAEKTSNLGLFSELPPFVSEEADRKQWESSPKVLGPSIATRLIQRGEATKDGKPSEPKKPD